MHGTVKHFHREHRGSMSSKGVVVAVIVVVVVVVVVDLYE